MIDFAVAIAAHTHDAVGQGIESSCHSLGIEPGGKPVARTVVEQIAEQQEQVATHLLIMGQHSIECCDRSVYVGDDEVLHKQELE